jgi:hypothetical protein
MLGGYLNLPGGPSTSWEGTTAVWARMIKFPGPNTLIYPASGKSHGLNPSPRYCFCAVSWDTRVGCVTYSNLRGDYVPPQGDSEQTCVLNGQVMVCARSRLLKKLLSGVSASIVLHIRKTWESRPDFLNAELVSISLKTPMRGLSPSPPLCLGEPLVQFDASNGTDTNLAPPSFLPSLLFCSDLIRTMPWNWYEDGNGTLTDAIC